MVPINVDYATLKLDNSLKWYKKIKLFASYVLNQVMTLKHVE